MIVHKLAPGLEGNIYEKDEEPEEAPILPEITDSQVTQDLEPNTQPLQPNTEQSQQRAEKRRREKEADEEYEREQEEERQEFLKRFRTSQFLIDEAQEE